MSAETSHRYRNIREHLNSIGSYAKDRAATATRRKPIVPQVRSFSWSLDGRSIPLGFGCAHLGNTGRSDYSQKDELDLLLRSYELGMRYYDTSRTYHESEVVVGEFIRRIDRKTIFLATKSMYPFREQNGFSVFRDNFFRSFERLQTDHIDLFQIHDTESFNICEAEVMPFLIEQRSRGLIDYIGIGTRSLNALELALLSGEIDSVLSYMNFSLLKRSAEPVIRLAQDIGASFVNASLLHFGAIKEPDPLTAAAGKQGYIRRTHIRAAAMRGLCDEMGIDPVVASLQYGLFEPGITMTLNGIRRQANLDATLAAMRQPIHPEQWARIYQLQNQDPCLRTQDDLL